MTAHAKMALGPSADRALAALETPGGKNRVKQYLASITAPDGASELEIDDLVRALHELRRRV